MSKLNIRWQGRVQVGNAAATPRRVIVPRALEAGALAGATSAESVCLSGASQGSWARQFKKSRMVDKIVPCLLFDGNAEEAAAFYAATFPDSRIDSVQRSPIDYPDGKAGDVLTVEFTILGSPFLGLNGGPEFEFNEAISFQIYTDDQAETDKYWQAIVDNGGSESVCGWCKDRFGLSWQIVPRVLIEAIKSRDRATSKRAMEAMMQMKKIDIAVIEAALRSNRDAVAPRDAKP